eukprot:8748117-Lingulodinium_polyedra.AAC.1
MNCSSCVAERIPPCRHSIPISRIVDTSKPYCWRASRKAAACWSTVSQRMGYQTALQVASLAP